VSLTVYNTMNRRKEEFIPREEGKVFMYVCGPTVYNFIHIGNGRAYLVFDVIRRYLSYKGYEVLYVQNFTDVDDKIINRAREEGKAPEEIALFYERAFLEDMQALNVLPPDITPRATETIPRMLDMIGALVDKGYAYAVDGDVYFRVESFQEYGKLSGRSLSEMRAGERVEIDARKTHPMDFALWKASKPGEPAWDSPWGKGRPGWHIECSAMSLHYLGMGFDIHGGGQDLVFPHHENEIAQSEAYAGTAALRALLAAQRLREHPRGEDVQIAGEHYPGAGDPQEVSCGRGQASRPADPLPQPHRLRSGGAGRIAAGAGAAGELHLRPGCISRETPREDGAAAHPERGAALRFILRLREAFRGGHGRRSQYRQGYRGHLRTGQGAQYLP
jgi:hypothetical protein